MDKKPLTIVIIAAILIALFFVLFFTLKHQDNSNVIRVSANNNFTITLDSNPTTGYKWAIDSPFDTKLLQLIGSKYTPTKTDLVGAPGKEDWTFKAKKKGKTILSFSCTRPWEKDTPPVKTDHFIIIIER